MPRALFADNMTEFVDKTIRELMEKFGIRYNTTSKYYPQSNPTEHYKRTIKTVIKAQKMTIRDGTKTQTVFNLHYIQVRVYQPNLRQLY